MTSPIIGAAGEPRERGEGDAVWHARITDARFIARNAALLECERIAEAQARKYRIQTGRYAYQANACRAVAEAIHAKITGRKPRDASPPASPEESPVSEPQERRGPE